MRSSTRLTNWHHKIFLISLFHRGYEKKHSRLRKPAPSCKHIDCSTHTQLFGVWLFFHASAFEAKGLSAPPNNHVISLVIILGIEACLSIHPRTLFTWKAFYRTTKWVHIQHNVFCRGAMERRDVCCNILLWRVQVSEKLNVFSDS